MLLVQELLFENHCFTTVQLQDYKDTTYIGFIVLLCKIHRAIISTQII